jgi:hypothetical protein
MLNFQYAPFRVLHAMPGKLVPCFHQFNRPAVIAMYNIGNVEARRL